MDGNTYKKFLKDIQRCSDKRLKEIYDATIDEMEQRAWHKKQVADTVEALSELENDWGMA